MDRVTAARSRRQGPYWARNHVRDTPIPMVTHRSSGTVRAVFVALGLLPSLVACGGSDSEAARSSTASTTAEADWSTLLTGEWEQAPGTEGYACVRKTNAEDLYVNSFSAINPLGTH